MPLEQRWTTTPVKGTWDLQFLTLLENYFLLAIRGDAFSSEYIIRPLGLSAWKRHVVLHDNIGQHQFDLCCRKESTWTSELPMPKGKAIWTCAHELMALSIRL